jgi:antitoxin ParD1/3/4
MRASLNISLPEEMKDWVEAHVQRSGYGTTSEYFRQLVRDDQRRQVRDEIDAKLLAALQAGSAEEITPEWWEERRKELARRIDGRRESK